MYLCRQAHPDISRVSPEANLCCFSCVNPNNFPIVDSHSPPVWSPVSFPFTMRLQRQKHPMMKLWNLLIFRTFAVLLWIYPAGQRTSPHCSDPPWKPPDTFARLVMSYSFHEAKTSSVRLRGAATSSFFHHLYVSRCPLWQIAIPQYIRSNLELPQCFAVF